MALTNYSELSKAINLTVHSIPGTVKVGGWLLQWQIESTVHDAHAPSTVWVLTRPSKLSSSQASSLLSFGQTQRNLGSWRY
jgi:hypothetical protein